MSAHTPGPWVVYRGYNGSTSICQMRHPDATICVNGPDFGKPYGFDATDANASLIAATVEGIADIRASEEGREGVQSFLQKRKPAWL